MKYLHVKDEFDGVRKSICAVIEEGYRVKRSLELCPLVLSIPYIEESYKIFSINRVAYSELVGPSGTAARVRTDRVYTDEADRVTKPSYRSRLIYYPDSTLYPLPRNSIDQISRIASDLALRPRISTLSFTFLRPSDLYRNIRPGYVPCPISGDFKFRRGRLILNVMFRSCDVLNFLYHDIFYMRRLQEEMLTRAKCEYGSKLEESSTIGDLNLFLSRAFVQTTESKSRYRGKKMLAEIEKFIDNAISHAFK